VKTAIDDTKTAVEASAIMKAFANLNPWAQGPGSSRSERHNMAAELQKYYGKRECMVVSSTKPVNVIGAHIWPLHAFPERMVELELDFDAVHHARNGLFLTKGIEKAFDKLQVTFLLDKEGVFRLRVLDDKLFEFWTTNSPRCRSSITPAFRTRKSGDLRSRRTSNQSMVPSWCFRRTSHRIVVFCGSMRIGRCVICSRCGGSRSTVWLFKLKVISVRCESCPKPTHSQKSTSTSHSSSRSRGRRQDLCRLKRLCLRRNDRAPLFRKSNPLT
jgi:hypothetical protein